MEETLEQKVARLEAENAQLKNKKDISFKVSNKGAVSVYGLGRFPVTLYKGQWERLLEKVDDLRNFIETNKAELAIKE